MGLLDGQLRECLQKSSHMSLCSFLFCRTLARGKARGKWLSLAGYLPSSETCSGFLQILPR